MRPRTLVPGIFCLSVLWPLWVLACGNSMELSRDYGASPLVDLAIWPLGAVFLNRVVLSNFQGPAVTGAPGPSGLRKTFFLFVGAALFLLVTTVLAIGPFTTFTAADFARCSLRPSALWRLMALPAGLFGLQAAFCHVMDRQLMGDKKRKVAIVALVLFTSLFLLVVFWLFREDLVLSRICRSPTFFSGDDLY